MIKFDSAKKSIGFYKKLGPEGMALYTSPSCNKAYIKLLEAILPSKGKVLDCACGYGRLAVPLSKQGFDITGIDLAANLIGYAKNLATKEKVNIDFLIGDMRDLPFPNNSFASTICMWSSFNHLLTETDQLQALKEMVRVTKKGGLVLIDLPYPKRITKLQIKSRQVFGKDNRFFRETFKGVENIVYIHNKRSLEKLLNQMPKCAYKIRKKVICNKKRLLIEIIKQ